MPPASRPSSCLLLTLGLAAALSGCGGGGGGGEIAAGGAVPEPSTTTTSAPPATSAAPTSTTVRRPTTTTIAAAAKARPTSTTAAAKPSRPKVVAANQGDRVVAVFVATGPSLADPSFAKARARLTAIGYRGTSGGDTACSRGAKEALPQLEEYSLSLEFATQADASRFATLYGPVIGTAPVTVSCAD